MKKFMKSLMLVAVAAMGLTACQNDINEQVNAAKGEVTVTFIANSADATRTSVSIDADKNVTFAWDEEESFVVLESIEGADPTQALSVDFENVDGLAEISATFESNTDFFEYNYVAVYPATAWAESNTTLTEAELIIPAEQTMAAASYDPAADLMISKLLTFDAQPSNEAFEMEFQRLVAVGKITVNGIPAGEVMKSVEFAAEGVTLAGSVVANLVNAEIGEAKTSSNSVVVNTTNATSNEVYFTCMPATLDPETNYTIIVTTDKGAYIKNGTIAKALEFKAGDVTGFKANMSTATKSEWQLVKNVEELEACDIVIIAAKDANSAMSTNQKSNNRGAADINKVGDFLAEPGTDVQQFTLVNGTKEATFAFYDRGLRSYLYAASSTSNHLKSQETINDNASWAITIANTGVATVKAQGTYTRNWMRFNDSNTGDSGLLFSCYGSGQKDICIYKYLSGKGTIPAIPVTINAENITIKKEATNADTKIEDITFSNIGEWNISVAEVEDADWLTVEYDSDEQAIYYTATENTGEDRSAEVRITASLEGEEDIIREFNINQKGAISTIKAITIEEFLDASVNSTKKYQLTGVITSIEKADYGNIYIKDATGEAYIYGLTAGEQSYNNKSFSSLNLKEGDVVTLVTVRGEYNGQPQGGGNSTPAYYISHYGLSVTATPESVDYLGGDVVVKATLTNTSEEVLAISTIYDEYDYATITPNNENTEITVNFDENTTAESRTVAIKFTAGMAEATVDIKQTAKPSDDGPTVGEEYLYTFTAKQFTANGTKTLGNLSWTLAGQGGGYWGWDSNGKGQQFGSKSAYYTSMTLSTSGYTDGVQKIVLNTSGASGTNAKVTVTVGGTKIGSTTSLTSSAKEYTFEADENEILSGEIVISYTQTSAKAIYIKKIAINPAN